jgi:hypothetical protein
LVSFFIKLSAANLGTKPRFAGEKENKEKQIRRSFSVRRRKAGFLINANSKPISQ